MTHSKPVSRVMVFVRLCVIIFSLAIGYLCQPMLDENGIAAVGTVVTIVSILAGFLIAIMVFVTEPTLRYAKNFRELQLRRGQVRLMLLKCRVLFSLYLITLFLALSVQVVPQNLEPWSQVLEIAFISFSLFVLLESFTLPSALMTMHMEIYDQELRKCQPRSVDKEEKRVGHIRMVK